MREYFLWLAKLITLLVVVVVGVPLVLGAIVAALVSASQVAEVAKVKESEKGVAVIEVDGIIMGSKDVLSKLHEYVADEDIQGIVLRVDSPGGAVAPSQEIYSAVKRLKAEKPIVASLGNVAASGGLYVALAASKVFSQPGTLTGSIGVILQVPNFTEIADKVGFQMITIKSGDLKDTGNAFRPMTEQEREYLERTARLAHEEFIKDVAEGRGIELDTVKAFADGRIILGSEAKDLKLVDEFGDIYDAARAVFELSGEPLPADEMPRLIYTTDRFEEFLEKVMESALSLREMRMGLW